MSKELEIFLANLSHAAENDGAFIGGGEFSRKELNTIYAEIMALIDKEENHGQ